MVDTIPLQPCPEFVADSAMASIEAQCKFGPRVCGTDAHRRCGDYLVQRFKAYGCTVAEQVTEVAGWDGKMVPVRNIVASINPGNPTRSVFCAHWDSRPWADNDESESKHRTPVMAANDGASGVAVLLEIARVLQTQPLNSGIDLICFDAEDMGTPQWADESAVVNDNSWCLGSTYWSQQAADNGYQANYGVLLDMVGGRGTSFSFEGYSKEYAGPVMQLIWHMADQLGYSQIFPCSDGGFITDDHVSMNRIAGIPTVDIVPYCPNARSSFGDTWHTSTDTPENIDPNVLKAVGQTLVQLIYNDGAADASK